MKSTTRCFRLTSIFAYSQNLQSRPIRSLSSIFAVSPLNQREHHHEQYIYEPSKHLCLKREIKTSVSLYEQIEKSNSTVIPKINPSDSVSSVYRDGSPLKWPFPDGEPLKDWSPEWHKKSRKVITCIYWTAKLGIFLNHFKWHNMKELVTALKNITPERSLITVSNHKSCVDDPSLWGKIPFKYISPKGLRWVLGASDIMFEHGEKLASFFAHGKVVPLVRGAGVYQRGMDFGIDLLNRGHWVHICPEGKVNMTDAFLRLKWGIGRLIAETKHTPLLIPIWHTGMENVLPSPERETDQQSFRVRFFNPVTVLVGEPLDLSATVADLRARGASAVEQRKVLTDLVEDVFRVMRARCEAQHLLNFPRLPQTQQQSIRARLDAAVKEFKKHADRLEATAAELKERAQFAVADLKSAVAAELRKTSDSLATMLSKQCALPGHRD